MNEDIKVAHLREVVEAFALDLSEVFPERSRDEIEADLWTMLLNGLVGEG